MIHRGAMLSFAKMVLSDDDYARLLSLRTGLRRFQRWSEQQAEAAGLTPAQHQLLLAIRGDRNSGGPTLSEIADYLLLRHHSAVGLVDRAVAAGLVSRKRDRDDQRVVHLRLTRKGAARLEALSALHLEELDRLALELPEAWRGLVPEGFPPDDSPGVSVGRVYDHTTEGVHRILVDRLWPRGVSRTEADIELWMRDIAPSPTLRQWYGHTPARFAQFERRYRKELSSGPAHDALTELDAMARTSPIVLLTAIRDVDHSGAAVLRDVLKSL
jgi:uncharacterized protein YeaO (DUF488 family)/DNA-binding MarR family transcriptional regulator